MIDTLSLYVQRHAVWFWALALFVGLGFQDLAEVLRPIVFPFAVLTMMMSMTRMDWTQVRDYIRRPGLSLLIGTMAMVVSPAAIWWILKYVEIEDGLATGLVLIAATPPLLVSLTYAIFLDLEGALAVTVSVPFNLLSPLIMPTLLVSILEIDLALGVGPLAWRLALMVGLSFCGAWLIRRLVPSVRDGRQSHRIDAATVFFMTTFGIGIMDGISAIIIDNPVKALTYVFVAVMFNAGMQLTAALCAWRLGSKLALTTGLVAGCRNVMLVIGAVSTSAAPDVMLFLIASQLPLYVFPAIQKPICRWILSDQRFKRPEQ